MTNLRTGLGVLAVTAAVTAGGPSSSGTSSSDSTTLRRPPTRPTVSRSPARVERRMIAHAPCPVIASIAVRASVAWEVMAEA